MRQEERLESLKARHHALDAAIEQKISSTKTDDLEIVALKKEKLRIKDEIAQLAR